MQRQHFDTLQPVCPVCKLRSGQLHRLVIAEVDEEEGKHIVQGTLHCSEPTCQREYPIIDGVPIIVRDIRSYLSDNAFQINKRSDLSSHLESIVGDCLGPDSTYDVCRQHLSSYAWDHYGDLDPLERGLYPIPGSMTRVLHRGLDLAEAQLSTRPTAVPMIDIGCSVGRGTFGLAERYGALTLGIDLNFPMLQLASRLLRTGQVSYPRRQVGVVYERREFEVQLPNAELVDFWACDALALPFNDGVFGKVVSMNVLDCVPSPIDFLNAISCCLNADGTAVIACPYDWSVSATSIECWIGGHSQRGAEAGSSEVILKRLLDENADSPVTGLKLLAEEELDWQVRIHSRSTMSYKSHLVVTAANHN